MLSLDFKWQQIEFSPVWQPGIGNCQQAAHSREGSHMAASCSGHFMLSGYKDHCDRSCKGWYRRPRFSYSCRRWLVSDLDMNIPNKTRFDESQMPLELVSLKMGEKVIPCSSARSQPWVCAVLRWNREVKQQHVLRGGEILQGNFWRQEKGNSE